MRGLSFDIVIYALFMAGLAGDRDFYLILPDNYLIEQTKLHEGGDESLYLLSQLEAFRSGEIDHLGQLDISKYWHIIDEHILGMAGFGTAEAIQRLGQVLEARGFNAGLALTLGFETGHQSFRLFRKRVYMNDRMLAHRKNSI